MIPAYAIEVDLENLPTLVRDFQRVLPERRAHQDFDAVPSPRKGEVVPFSPRAGELLKEQGKAGKSPRAAGKEKVKTPRAVVNQPSAKSPRPQLNDSEELQEKVSDQEKVSATPSSPQLPDRKESSSSSSSSSIPPQDSLSDSLI